MFLSFSKTLAKVGGFRLGIRMTKKNAAYMWMILLFVCMLKFMWYMLVLCLWIMYAMLYGIYWGIKRIFQASKKRKPNRKA